MIPVNEPLLGKRESEFVNDCLETGWISSSGRYIDEFEQRWAAYCGRRYGIAVSNGTTALHLAVSALDIQPGEEIILPSFTIISCVQAILMNGGIPVLVDSDPETWCLDVQQVERKISSRTRAIMAVHIYGHPADMDPLLEIASSKGLAVIEDAAEAHGAECLVDRGGRNPQWKRCGGLGTISTFSFYANKILTTGEGGMLLTDDPELAERSRSLRNLCFRRERRFLHTELGFNYRLTNIQAALGVAQLETIEARIERKRRMGREYSAQLFNLGLLQLPCEKSWARPVYWMYGVVLAEESGMNAQRFAEKLAALEVETRPFFLGMHDQPVLKERGYFKGEKFPVADRIARQGLYLPSGLALTDSELRQVCCAVTQVLEEVA